jgi:5'-3' exoribonuclease 2
MGIPSYFAWLVRHFEESIVAQNCPFGQIEDFYLDFNCGIHPAARSDATGQISCIYDAIILYLEYLLDVVNPKDRIYIAIDGVAPVAKMDQQHDRRFRSVKDIIEVNKLKTEYGVKFDVSTQRDFNMISPATEFMTGLSIRILEFLQNLKNTKYANREILFSDASVPGEGEHKILNEIKSRSSERKIGIYGLDSDLIMLSLSTNYPNIVLVREDNMITDNKINLETGKFPQLAYFIISELRDSIINVMNPYTSTAELEGVQIFKNKGKNIVDLIAGKELHELLNMMKSESFFTTEAECQNLISDYIFMSFFLGNDFVPSFEALKIRDGGIDQILKAYKIVIQRKRQYLWQGTTHCSGTGTGTGKNQTKGDNGGNGGKCNGGVMGVSPTINHEFFVAFVTILADLESDLLMRQKASRDRRIRMKSHPDEHQHSYEDAYDNYDYVENRYKDTINVFQDGWKKRYYNYFFHVSPQHQASQIPVICKEYIRALHWIAGYYFSGCPDWEWHYPYGATPLLSDLLQYVKDNPQELNNITFPQNQPLKPFSQLLIILPPQSRKLLPESYQKIMTNDDSPLIHYYPIDFELEYYGKRYRWECHPKIPMIIPSELQSLLPQLDEKLTDCEHQRNTLGQVIVVT